MLCDHRGVKIECWDRRDEKTTMTAPTPKPEVVTALRTAIEDRRATDGDDATATLEVLSPVPGWLRTAARLVLGIGSVAITGMFLALVVVGADTRHTLLLATGAVAGLGAVFVTVVWQLDVTLTLHRNGRLVRKGWNGFTEVWLRDCQRVVITVGRTESADASDREGD